MSLEELIPLPKMKPRPPKKLADGDYILREGAAWIEVSGLAIRIRAVETGVLIQCWPVGKEDEDSTDSFFVSKPEKEGDNG
jgi:hypothetical protein